MTPVRKAAPPRPTLLLDGLEGCHAAFARLQSRMEEAYEDKTPAKQDLFSVKGAPPAPGPWRDLVPLCRSLRETLTSLHEMSDFTRRVYEAGADVCARAGDWGEALKCITLLSETIYPALAAAEEGRAAADVAGAVEEELAGLSLREPAGPPSGCRPGGGLAERTVAASAATDGRLARWQEVASCHVAFFACLDPGGRHGWDTAATLRQLPPAVLAAAPVQTALRALSALAAGLYVPFFRLVAVAPPLLRLVLEARGAAERVRGVGVISAAYRTAITAGVVAGMLAVAAEEELEQALQRLAGSGNTAAELLVAKLGMDPMQM